MTTFRLTDFNLSGYNKIMYKIMQHRIYLGKPFASDTETPNSMNVNIKNDEWVSKFEALFTVTVTYFVRIPVRYISTVL